MSEHMIDGRAWGRPIVTLEEAGGLCTVTHGVIPCRQRATGSLTLGCVHEHVFVRPACSQCYHLAQQLSGQGLTRCGECQHGQEPHRCPCPLVRWEPLP